MNNPYEVLGVNQNASQAEIKAAYKELVKKYHPDKYQNNPLADLAQEKLQEVNEAYDYLTKNGSQAAQSPYESNYNGGSRAYQFTDIRQALDRNDLARAEQMLISNPNRNGEWFFLSGILSYKKGWFDDAVSNIKQAIALDPNNMEYQTIYQRLMSGGVTYRGRSTNQGYNQRGSDPCADCCAMYLCSSCISPCW